MSRTSPYQAHTPATHPDFAAAVSSLASEQTLQHHRGDLTFSELPAPAKLAPFAVALHAEVVELSQDPPTGRLVVLFDPNGNPAWEGRFRFVSYIRSLIEPELGEDPLLPDVGWSWLVDGLTQRDATYQAPSATITRILSHSFGQLAAHAAQPDVAEIEIRASWTPADQPITSLGEHFAAWCDVLRMTAGIPLSDEVIMLDSRRTR